MDLETAPSVRKWLVVAVLLHTAPLALLGRTRSSTPVTRASTALPSSFDIEVTPLEPATSPGGPVGDPTAAPLRVSVTRLATTGTTRSHEASSLPPAEGLLAAPDTGRVATGDASWSIQFARGPDRLAAGQVPNAFGSRRAADPEEATHSRTGGVAEALTEADVSRGLGRGGPVVLALEEIARTHDAPVRGVAVFEVTVDRNGQADVALARADAEASSWAGLAQAMSDAIAKKHVRIPDGAAGLRVAVELDARVQLPNGQDPRAVGGFAHATGLVLADDSMVVKSVPGVNVGAVGEVCSGGLHVGLDGVAIQGGCDPSNIGAVPVRIVHGRELGERPM